MLSIFVKFWYNVDKKGENVGKTVKFKQFLVIVKNNAIP